MSFGDGGSDIEVTGAMLMQMMPAFNTRGLSSDTRTIPGIDKPIVDISSSPERDQLVSDISNRFKDLGASFRDLRGKVAPGFSQIRKSRLQAVETARRRNQQNLAGNFARRRFGGSSFAADQLTRADREFAEATAAEEARTFLEEMGATAELLQNEAQADIAGLETILNEMNIQSQVALSVINGAQGSIGSAINTALSAEASRRAGELSVGEFFSGLAGSALTNIVGMGTQALGQNFMFGGTPAATPTSTQTAQSTSANRNPFGFASQPFTLQLPSGVGYFA